MSYKQFFTLPADRTYFNTAYMGPVPNAARDAGVKAVIDRSQNFWQISPSDFFSGTEQLRERVAQTICAPTQNVAFIPAVSYGIEIAVKALKVRCDREIVYPQDDFPSNVYPWQAWCKSSGAKLICVPRPENFDWTSAVLAKITDRTDIVSVPINDWSDGTLFDLKSISKACKRVNAKLIVDASQSLGSFPIDVREFDPDFLVSVGYKWQLGPYGLSYLYVSDRWLEAEPLENGWLNRKGSEDFSRLVEYQDEYQPGARRFDCGQRAQLILTPIALESMRFLQDIGIDTVFAHNASLTTIFRERLAELDFQVPPAERLAGHMVGVRHRNWLDMQPLAAALKQNGFSVSARGTALRISPHIYNSLEDVDKLCTALKRIKEKV